MKWKIANNSQCNFCSQGEDYLYYFISCPYLKELWVKRQQILNKTNIENCVTLKHIVFGYKILVFNDTVKNVRYNVEHGDQFYWCLTPLSTMLVIA